MVMDVPMVDRAMTGRGWLMANCCCANGVRRADCVWLWTMPSSCWAGVTERASLGCGVEQGVLVGVGVDGLGVPDPKEGKTKTNDEAGNS